jgi:hypothetical protein
MCFSTIRWMERGPIPPTAKRREKELWIVQVLAAVQVGLQRPAGLSVEGDGAGLASLAMDNHRAHKAWILADL